MTIDKDHIKLSEIKKAYDCLYSKIEYSKGMAVIPDTDFNKLLEELKTISL